MWQSRPAMIPPTLTHVSRPAMPLAYPPSATLCGTLISAAGAKSKKCYSSERAPTGQHPVLTRVACPIVQLMAFAQLAFAPFAPFSARARLHGTQPDTSSVNANMLSLPHATFPATMRPFASSSPPSTTVNSDPASPSWMPQASATSLLGYIVHAYRIGCSQTSIQTPEASSVLTFSSSKACLLPPTPASSNYLMHVTATL